MRTRNPLLVLTPIALLALAGCAGSQASTREETATTGGTSQQQGMQGMQGMQAMCPMGVEGTKVEASNTDTGAALTFTNPSNPAELRRRVTAMAEMHNTHHAGQGMAGQGAPGGCACGHEAKGCNCPGHAAGSGQGGSGCAGCDHQEGQACNCPEHGAKAEGTGCACGQHEGHAGMKMGMGMGMPASRATTEEVPDGIRLVLTPVDPTQLDALREGVRHHAEMMSSGQCPMMRAHGG